MAINLYEGGNVFKDAEGNPLTQRIARDNVVPTVQWLEGLTGLNLVDNMLGSTGRADTSGDLDLGVDAGKVSKELLIQQLLGKGIDPKDIRKSGDSVHLKTPILGDPNNGYVQTDFMFTDNPAWQHFALTGGAVGSQFKGMHRHVLLSSIAKALGLKWSPKFGLLDRETNEVITQDPAEIASKLLNGSVADLTNVETILNKIKNRPDYEKLVADARDTFSRENLTLPETKVYEGSAQWFRNFML